MTLPWKRVLSDGLVTGAVGYVLSVLVFSLSNIIDGRSPLYTPALLGSILFYDVHDAAAITISSGPIIAFNGAYLAVYLGVGFLLSFLAAEADRGPHVLYLAAAVGLLGLLHVIGASVVISQLVGESLNVWHLLAAGLLGGVAMLVYLYGVHPDIRAAIPRDVELNLD